ncbi:MAG: selenide, water dikinase SelD, partial [Flavobacteriaceae bacterium]|nr:selenide, water dikinase SelD [Flavobacteriaceae bacterium]
STAIKKEKASKSITDAASDSMKELNKKASEIAKNFQPNAVTDITGFGLIGHLIEVCNASNVSANVYFKEIEFLPGAIDLVNEGIMPGGSKRNLDHAENFTTFSSKLSFNQKLLVCDAQTSGGLLISLTPKDAKKFLNQFGEKAKIIGEIQPRKTKPITVKF